MNPHTENQLALSDREISHQDMLFQMPKVLVALGSIALHFAKEAVPTFLRDPLVLLQTLKPLLICHLSTVVKKMISILILIIFALSPISSNGQQTNQDDIQTIINAYREVQNNIMYIILSILIIPMK